MVPGDDDGRCILHVACYMCRAVTSVWLLHRSVSNSAHGGDDFSPQVSGDTWTSSNG